MAFVTFNSEDGAALSSPKNQKVSVIPFCVVFGSIFLFCCVFANVAMITVVNGPATVAAYGKFNSVWDENRNDKQDLKTSPTYLLITWGCNFWAALITIPTIISGLFCFSKLNAKEEIFKESFMIFHGFAQFCIFGLGGVTIFFALRSKMIATDENSAAFAVFQLIFVSLVLFAAVLLKKDIFRLAKNHGNQQLTACRFVAGNEEAAHML